MLIQSSLPSSIEAALSFVSDHGKQDLLCDWIPSDESPKCDERPWDGCRESVSFGEEKENAADYCSLIHSRSYSQLSTVGIMCASSAPNLVYKRRKLQRNSVALLSAQAATNSRKGSGDCLSNISSGVPPLVAKKDDHLGSQIKNEIHCVRTPVMTSGVCNRDLLGSGDTYICGQLYPQKLDDVPLTHINNTRGLEVSKSESINGCTGGEEQGFDEAPTNRIHRSALEYYSVNDSCSSSKSNMELGSTSLKTDMDDNGECSSSDILTKELLEGSTSEKELCISILRSHGLLEGVCPVRSCASIEVLGINGDSNHSQSCKICGHSGNSLNMLICDNCEEAFHVSCCNPRIKKIPVDEWYCHPCLKKKRKLSLETTTGKSLNVKSEMSECRSRASKGGLGSILFMLKDTEPYTSGVRIGKAFQAEVPDWSGPISNDFDFIGEPLEMDPAECVCLHGWNTNKSSTPNTIGNWLQCREVIDDNAGESAEGAICGKWRRAPLFEVQTDDWDCSCSVIWDPIHSDCAVPQELGTDQVLMHLKYIELLRPRLAAKKRKLSRSKSDTEDMRSAILKNGRDS